MKRSYFIFYGSAVAYCISMLAALQIGNISMTYSAVKKTTVSACCSDETHCFQNRTDYYGYSNESTIVNNTTESSVPAASTLSQETYIYREQNAEKAFFSVYTQEAKQVKYINNAQVGNGSDYLYALTSSKLYLSQEYMKSLYKDLEIEIHHKTGMHSLDNTQILEGFNFIIDFPDKLS
ncbi:hypothetical protein JET18_01065 [Chryseobacterium sp. L7]|uniref:Uncharacterized protein n=1 Tax=Chryseobacterium endalhagicum TaxID=2797638 RepID=A0ABS1Q9X7_9FLAO|nr:hypothetical protein [Chryseobacterium endalhagicum]MBL1219404.1 hypothetical protein [Chryseobacterium endalhagicum]